MFPIDQGALNVLLDARLRTLGWSRQPFVSTESSVFGHLPSYMQGDFAKEGVFVEVEFGNGASLFRDLFKFQIASRSGVGELGVLVVATARVGKWFDQGVATLEQAVSLLPFMKLGLSLPTAIIGLDLNDWTDVERRYREMQAVAEANGVSCHSFEAVMGAIDPPALDL